ncbi:MAG: ATP-binding protein [Kiritimatiellia bacterium]
MQIDAAFELFRHAHRQARLAHAYLIAGPIRGAAGELVSRVLQLLFCTRVDGPCGVCNPCRQARQQTLADIFWLKPEKKSRVISADAMREKMLAEIAQTSLAGGWKAGVIVGADRLSDAAANIFLKTLEEPPPQTLFLLLTDAPQELLATIVSRCQRMEIDAPHVLPEPWRMRLLECLSSATPPGPVPAMALASRLVAILSDMKDAAEVEVKAEIKAEAETMDEDSDGIKARISARYREMRADLLRAMLNWYRDLLVLHAGGTPDNIHFPAHLALLQERAARLTLAQAMANVDGAEELNRQLDRSLSEDSVLTYWMDRLVSGVPAPSPAARGITG